jgi:hypothetical protein
VLPDPESTVPDLLHSSEIAAFRALDAAFGPMIRDLGDHSDPDDLSDPRWPSVLRASEAALVVMQSCDDADSG